MCGNLGAIELLCLLGLYLLSIAHFCIYLYLSHLELSGGIELFIEGRLLQLVPGVVALAYKVPPYVGIRYLFTHFTLRA